MPKIEALTSEDKKVLKNRLVQGSLPVLIALLITCSLLALIAFGILRNFKTVGPELFYVIGGVVVVINITFWVILNRNTWLDLKSGKKLIEETTLHDKSEDPTFGFSTAAPYSRARMDQYILIASSTYYYVKKEVYESYEKGDRIRISKGTKSHKMITIEKA